jgi:trimethylamine:corrinoid methyltransferase-like protein
MFSIQKRNWSKTGMKKEMNSQNRKWGSLIRGGNANLNKFTECVKLCKKIKFLDLTKLSYFTAVINYVSTIICVKRMSSERERKREETTEECIYTPMLRVHVTFITVTSALPCLYFVST